MDMYNAITCSSIIHNDKKFPEIVYTEIVNLTHTHTHICLHNIFFKVVSLVIGDTLLLMFVKLLEAFLENVFPLLMLLPPRFYNDFFDIHKPLSLHVYATHKMAFFSLHLTIHFSRHS